MSACNPVDQDSQEWELDCLVGSRLSELGLRPSALVRRWGYANTSKGMGRLAQLRAGHCTPDRHGVSALASALEVPVEDLHKAIEVTQQQLEQARKRSEEQEWREWCRRFEPHAILKTDQPRPSPIFVAAILGPDRILRLDFDLNWSPVTWPFQVAGRLPDRVPAFGKMIGFYLNYTPERAVEFDRAGRVLRGYPAALRPGRAWMEHKGRDVTPAWRAATRTS